MKRLLLVLALGSGSSALPAQACPTAALQTAFASGSLASVVQAFVSVTAAGADCSVEQRFWAGRLTALAHGVQAERLISRGASPADALLIVEEGLRFGRPWQLLRQRGELLMRVPLPHGRPNFAEASATFQAALNDMNDATDEEPPQRREFERLLALADQSRMAASSVVQLPRTRSGELGGLALRSVRGFEVREVMQPIHFVWGSTDFADLGRAAADQLYDMLAQESFPVIRLIGHTDPDGTNAYNLRLSRERAERVRRYLEGRGYPPGRISTEGRGEEEPLTPAVQGVYTQEEFHQILRRVVLVRS